MRRPARSCSPIRTRPRSTRCSRASPRPSRRSTSLPTTAYAIELWVIADEVTIVALTRAIDALPALYIADGHHRSAAALRVAQARGEKDGYFLAVLLPQREMTILDYNRVLRDLNGLTAERGFEGNRPPVHNRAERPAGSSELAPTNSAWSSPGAGIVSPSSPRSLRNARKAKTRSLVCRSRCSPRTFSNRFSPFPISDATSASTSSAAAAGLGELERLVSSGSICRSLRALSD